MRMNKYVYVLLVFAVAFTAMQLLTWSTAEAGKYPRIRADAGNDFKVFENQNVKLDGSDSKGGFKKFVDYDWELVRVNGAKVQNNQPIAIDNDDKPEASFKAPEVAAGEVTYEFKLKVKDEVDREDDDIVTVHVMNQQGPAGPVGPT